MSQQPSYPWCASATESPHPVLIAVYWCSFLIWIFNIILGVFGTYKLMQLKHDRALFNFTLLFVLIAVLFIISPPSLAFAMQSGWECWYNAFRPWEVIYVISLDAYIYGLAAIYFFFMMRLKKVFENTTLKLSKLTIMFLSIGLIIQLIAPIFSSYYFLSGWNAYDRKWGLRYYSLFSYTNIFFSITVLAIFVKKIFLLSRNSRARSSNMVDKELLQAATRYMICCLFAMITTNIVGIVGMVRGFSAHHSDLVLRGIHILLRLVDTTFNLLFLHFQFPYGRPLYDKCCGKLDIFCQACFVKILELQESKSVKNLAREIAFQNAEIPAAANVKNVETAKTKSAKITGESAKKKMDLMFVL